MGERLVGEATVNDDRLSDKDEEVRFRWCCCIGSWFCPPGCWW